MSREETSESGVEERAITVAGCQIRQVLGDRDANLRTAEAEIRAHPGHDIYVLPELSSSGYGGAVFRGLDQFTENWDGPSFEAFSALAAELGCHICYSFPRRRRGGGYTIAAAVVGPTGEAVVRYDKWHVCSTGVCCERDFFVDGKRPLETFEVGGVTVGVCICYDIRFPELVRRLTVEQEIMLLLHPVGWPRDEGFHTWHPFVLTRAVENTISIMSTNWAGSGNGYTVFCPPFVDGQTSVPVFLEDEPGVLVGTVDPAALRAIRGEYPFLADRNREMYG